MFWQVQSYLPAMALKCLSRDCGEVGAVSAVERSFHALSYMLGSFAWQIDWLIFVQVLRDPQVGGKF